MSGGKFSERLRTAMDSRGLTQVQLANGTSLTQAAVSRYLSGIHEPKSRELYAIARFLGVTMESLLSDQAAPTEPASVGAWRQRALAAEEKVRGLKDGIAAILKKF